MFAVSGGRAPSKPCRWYGVCACVHVCVRARAYAWTWYATHLLSLIPSTSTQTGGLAGLDALNFNEDDFKDDDTGIKKMWTVMTKAKVTS